MPHHFSKQTSAVRKFCDTCKRDTMHKVSGGRLGRCMENHVKGPSQKQRKAAEKADAWQEPGLFD